MSVVASVPPLLPVGTDRVNILIVDDEPKNLMVLETVLDDPGYNLIRANSGEEALLSLMAHEFAVLVLDVRMPGMTGFELAQLVKELEAARRRASGDQRRDGDRLIAIELPHAWTRAGLLEHESGALRFF